MDIRILFMDIANKKKTGFPRKKLKVACKNLYEKITEDVAVRGDLEFQRPGLKSHRPIWNSSGPIGNPIGPHLELQRADLKSHRPGGMRQKRVWGLSPGPHSRWDGASG